MDRYYLVVYQWIRGYFAICVAFSKPRRVELKWQKVGKMCTSIICCCIVISFTSIYVLPLSEHWSYKTCAKDENNAEKTKRVFCITNKRSSSTFKSFDQSWWPFCYSALRPHFCFDSVILRQFFVWCGLDQHRHLHRVMECLENRVIKSLTTKVSNVSVNRDIQSHKKPKFEIRLDPVSRITGIPGWYWILGIKCSDTTGVGLVYWNRELKSGQGHTPISKHRHAMHARVIFL